MNLILTPDHIRAVAPGHPNLEMVVAALAPVIQRYGIDQTPERLGMFLASLAHESNFQCQAENLNYSAGRLCQVWPNRFPSLAHAQPYAQNPQALANKVYNGRMGNTPGSNDGWNYRGRGLIQLTGRAAYRAYGQAIGQDLEGNPNLALRLDVAAAIAGAFWNDRGLNRFADAGDLVSVTQRINGGQNGIDDRVARYRRVVPLLREQAAALAAQDAIVHPTIPVARLFVNGLEMDLASVVIVGDTITLPSGQHRIARQSQVGEKLYVQTA